LKFLDRFGSICDGRLYVCQGIIETSSRLIDIVDQIGSVLLVVFLHLFGK
jgi:hypothetical protein